MADGAGAGAAKRKADEGPEELRVRTMYEGLWARILAFETLGIRWIDRSVAAKEDFFSEPHYYRCLLCKTKNKVAKKNVVQNIRTNGTGAKHIGFALKEKEKKKESRMAVDPGEGDAAAQVVADVSLQQVSTAQHGQRYAGQAAPNKTK